VRLGVEVGTGLGVAVAVEVEVAVRVEVADGTTVGVHVGHSEAVALGDRWPKSVPSR